MKKNPELRLLGIQPFPVCHHVIAIAIVVLMHQKSRASKLIPPGPCISESCIKLKINLNFYFDTSLWCLEWFYEGL